MELLAERIQLANKLPPLLGQINLHSVITLQNIPQMLDLGDPGKWIALENNRGNFSTISLRNLKHVVMGLAEEKMALTTNSS